MNSRRTLVRSGLAALAITLAAPVAAQAATASFSAGVFTLTGAATGETITTTDSPPNVAISATSAGLADPDGAGTDCTLVNANLVQCANAVVTGVIVNAGDGSDTINFSRSNAGTDTFAANGEGSGDTLTTTGFSGSAGLTTLSGGTGTDDLTGDTASNPVLNGDEGDDSFTNPGSGTASGGADNDTMTSSGLGAANGDGGNDAITKSGNGSVNGGTGVDTITINSGSSGPVDGGDGDDTINGMFGGVNGGPGNDTLNAGGGAFGAGTTGGDGNDTLNGNSSAADSFVSEPGADTYTGGGDGLCDFYECSGSSDSISYVGDAAVAVTLDDAANDGTPGELDNVKSDIERVSGGNGNDSLDASAAANGPKSLSGGLGDDTIVGSPVSSLLAGGDGNDTITGGAGVDLIYGDSGIDSINSRDRGRDRVDCGLGVDNPVQGDVGDQLTGCEGTAVLTPLAPPKPTLGGPRKIKASTFAKKRTVSVTALPSGPARLDGELWAAGRLAKAGQLSRGSAKPGQLSLGTARLGLAAGKRTLKIKVSKSNAKAIVKKARSRALRKKGYRVTVTVTATDAAGLSGTATRTIRITR